MAFFIGLYSGVPFSTVGCLMTEALLISLEWCDGHTWSTCIWSCRMRSKVSLTKIVRTHDAIYAVLPDIAGPRSTHAFNMNRSDIADELAAKFSHLTTNDTESAVAVILEAMVKALAAKQRIEIRGFGSFSTAYRRPSIGRNPRTGESVFVPGRSVPHFKPGKQLREAVDGCSLSIKSEFRKVQIPINWIDQSC